ncbi:hypothetical protein LSH36_618g01071, partial [Paralvinella palmiformis]
MLKEEIKALFIMGLQRDNSHTWLYLKECIMQLSPLAHLVQGQADIVHYLKRLQHHLSVHRERLFELQIDKTINDVFAKEDHAETKPRPLTFGDLREAIWKACLGTTAIALNIDLPECLEE